MTGRVKKRIALLVGAVVLLIAMVVGAYAIQQAHNRKLMDQWLRDGMVAYKAGEYPTTMELLGHYAGRDKTNEEVILALADARRRTPMENGKHILLAISFARLAAELKPADTAPLTMLLDLYGKANFVTERLQVADALLILDKDNHDAMIARVLSLAVLGKTKEARAAAMAITVAHPSDVRGHQLAMEFMNDLHEDPNDIRKHADDAAAQFKDDPRFVVMQAQAHAGTGDSAGAVELARQAAKMPVRSAEDLGSLLTLMDLLSRKDPSLTAAADELLEREVDGPLAHDVAGVAAERAWKSGRPEEARQYAAKGIDPANLTSAATDALGWWAFLGLAGGAADAAEVKPVVAELGKRSGAEAAYWADICAGASELAAGRLSAAHQHFALAQASGYHTDIAEYLLGDVLQREGEWRRTASSWEKLAAAQPSWRVISISLVTLLLQHDQAEEAVQQAGRAVTAHPTSFAEIMSLTRAMTALMETGHARQEQMQGALSIAENLERDAKNDPTAQALVARIYLSAGHPQKGVELVRAMIGATPPPPPALMATLVSPIRPHDAALADRALSMARAGGDSPDIDFQVACELAAAGKPEEGRTLLQASTESHQGPDHLAYQLRLAEYLDRISDPGARAAFSQLSSAHENEPAIQLAVLRSDSAWKDEAVVSAAIGRLKGITGESGSGWKVNEARRLLVFSPSPANAAEAINKYLTDALRLDPNNTLALALTAEANVILGNRAEAIKMLSKSVDLQPNLWAPYPRLIDLLQQSGAADEAGRRLEAFRELPNLPTSVLRQRAKLLAAQGMWDQAAYDFVQLVPGGNIEDRFSLGVVLSRKGDAAGAKQNMDAVLQSSQLTVPMLVSIADYYASQGDVDQGLEVLNKHLPEGGPGQRAATLGAFFERFGRLPQAEQQYIEQAKDGKAESLADLAKFYYKRGRVEEAKAAVDRGLVIEPTNPTLQQISGFIKLSKGSSREAMTDIAGSMNSLEDSSPLKQLAAALQELEKNPTDTDGYLKRLEAITKDNPGFFPAWKLLVEGRYQRGDTKDAIEAALTAARSSPVDPRPAGLATNILTAAGEYDQAMHMAQEWRQRSITQPFEADVGIATINGAQKHYEEGLRRLDPWKARIIAEADSAPGRLQLLAELLANGGHLQEAQDLMWPRADKDPRWALRCLEIAENLPGPAQEQWIGRMSPLLDKSPAGLMALGKVLFKIAQTNETKANYERAIVMFKGAVDDTAFRGQAAFFLASSYEQVGDKANAIRYYRMAVDTTPNDALALNNLAFLLTEDPGTAPEAATLAQKAVDLGSAPGFDSGLLRSFLDTLGVALLKSGKPKEAEAAFRKGLAMNPNTLDLNVGLAEARLSQGFPEDAKRILRIWDVQSPTGSPQDPNLAKRVADIKRKLQDTK